jgi:hypothetical protein
MDSPPSSPEPVPADDDEDDIPDEFCLGCGLHESDQHSAPLAKVRCPVCGSEVDETPSEVDTVDEETEGEDDE